MRIDSFQYFTPQHPPEHLGPILARNRFQGSIAVARDISDPRELLRLVAPHPYVVAAFPCLDLLDPHLPALLDECRTDKFRGVLHTLASAVPESLALLVERNLALDLVLSADQIPLAAETARLHPALRIAAVNLSGGDFTSLAACPNVFYKAVHPANLRQALAAFTPARVMFGSNWPANLPHRIWKASLAAFTQALGAQPIDIREQVLGGTAIDYLHPPAPLY